MSFAESMGNAVAVRGLGGFVDQISRQVKFLLNRFKPGAVQKLNLLQVESRLSLGPKRNLTVVSCKGERFLVASSGDSISTIVPLRAGAQGRRMRLTSDSSRRSR